MENILDNKKSKISEVLLNKISKGSDISVLSSYFTIYAFHKLKDTLKYTNSFRFLFLEPTFTEKKEEIREFYINRLNREKQIAGNEYEIKLRNELIQSQIAHECSSWIEKNAEFRSLKSADVQGKFIHVIQNINNEELKNFTVYGALDFTSSGLGFTNSKKYEISVYSEDQNTSDEFLEKFNEFWNNADLVEDVKAKVIENIKTIYKEHSPEYLYFLSLYHLFQDSLDDLDEEKIIKSKTGFKETAVWNKLYSFQKDGVMGAIDKLEKYNGCIIADSVGLGKTFEALAVIKYYELRNDRVLVLCPKKLRENWLTYKRNDTCNILVNDRFNYDVLNHTDLSRGDKGYSGDINLASIHWSNYDLIVIDESHNFRNNNARKNTKTRYQKLIEDIIKSGVKTKVLMLSATPVNNKMNDLKNQVAFITEANDKALLNEGIHSIEQALRTAQGHFNRWLKLSNEDRKLDKLLKMLNVEYFKLLDCLTIARSRKHIQKYYNLDDVGKFPIREKPINIESEIDTLKEFPSFTEINDSIRRLSLAIYSPLQYIYPEKEAYYAEKYDIKVKDGHSSFRQADREKNLVNLMRVNILKRLESSVFSFNLTVKKIISKIQSQLEMISKFNGSGAFSLDYEDDDSLFIEDDEQMEALISGTKLQVKLEDIDLVRWREDLEADLLKLEALFSKSSNIDSKRDSKLNDLKNLITEKLKKPLNQGNKKLIIFSAFADTAHYLYENISGWLRSSHGIESALVTGTGSNKVSNKKFSTDFNSILSNFSPLSKERKKLFPELEEEIDILIATDCVSEGQNLQDCDSLVNYDIHWNPVRIIQRFGRIDRIGSKNERIQLINFWPAIELDEYIKLEQRVRGRMMLLNTSATGEDDIINQTDQDIMNDIEFRKNQLTKLKAEVVDLEDISGNISITDLTMTDFKMDLMEYLKENKDILAKAPLGIYALCSKDQLAANAFEGLESGVIFILKQVAFSDLVSKETNALHPYYMVYISETGLIKHSYLQSKYILDIFRKLAKGNTEVRKDLVEIFNQETLEAKDMSKYSELLENAISEILGEKTQEGIKEIFSTVGKTNISKNVNLRGLDDFELISFLIIK